MSALSATHRPRLVLTMIVKDEAPVLVRCLDSIRPLIDAWCIVDTGSTDGTQQLVRSALADLPGQLHERPWIDFARNRTETLDLARPLGEYAVMIDADTVCELDPSLDVTVMRASLTADVYDVTITLGSIRYHRPQITSTALPFTYRGVLHEALVQPEGAASGGLVAGITFRSETDGARSRNPTKYLDDAAVLRGAIARGDEPDLLARYTFYLAQSYRDAGELERSLAAYEQRASMTDGWHEERCMAWLAVGHLRRQLAHPVEAQLHAYLRAYDCAPTRAEPLYYAATVARLEGRLPTAFACALAGHDLRRPDRGLFIEPDVYDWRLAYELGISAYYVERPDIGIEACRRVLAAPGVPTAEREATERNLGFYGPS